MSPALMYAADAVAILLLVFALFLPRHGRRELVVAYLGVNVGVLAVASALATSTDQRRPRARAVRRAVDHPAALGGAVAARGRLLLRGAGARPDRRAVRGAHAAAPGPDGAHRAGAVARRPPAARPAHRPPGAPARPRRHRRATSCRPRGRRVSAPTSSTSRRSRPTWSTTPRSCRVGRPDPQGAPQRSALDRAGAPGRAGRAAPRHGRPSPDRRPGALPTTRRPDPGPAVTSVHGAERPAALLDRHRRSASPRAPAALLTRVDRKYLVPRSALPPAARRRRPATPASCDIDGRRSFSYHSVYLDTPDLQQLPRTPAAAAAAASRCAPAPTSTAAARGWRSRPAPVAA